VAALVVGGFLAGSAVVASAAGAGPSITVSPDTGLSSGSALLMNGTGFTKNAPSPGGFMECSTASGQPTVTMPGFSTPIPVSCSDPVVSAAKVSKSGNIGYTGTQIVTGTVGPPQTGPDTGGSGDAATDAANYPCPPYPAQVSAGAVCEILYLDDAGQSASQVLGFTTTSTPTTSTTTTTTAAPCNAVPKTVTATAPNGTATVTLTPDTCLVAGSKVVVTASGLMPASSTNLLGSILECSDDPGQPTVALDGHAFPVSCTAALGSNDFTPNAAGTLTQNFTVVVGTTGPPTSGTASDGNDAAADAAKYPCPPTAAQTSDTCVIAVGDLGGDKVVVPISFNPGGAGSSSSTGSGGGSSATKSATSSATAKAATTKASSGALAFTGAGPGLWWLGMIGVVLMVMGGLVLIMLDEHRRILGLLVRRRR
jgi:hypothetical protein